MTSPPFLYICKKCKHNNWFIPHPLKFICEKCKSSNKVHLFMNWWWTSVIKTKGII